MIAMILLAAFLVGPGSVILASLVFRLPEDALKQLTPRVLSFAVGALLGMALLRMLPHALEHHAPLPILRIVLGAILFLFLLERFHILRHCHEFQCQEHAEMPIRIGLGNASHALVDGLALALAFQVGNASGWIFALALMGHEVPKALVSLVLLKGGREPGAAFMWNFVPSVFTVVGALLASLGLAFVKPLAAYALAAGAAFFLYLALADLVPRHRRSTSRAEALWQAGMVLAGAGLIFLLPGHG
ncbi:MAG: ZIP family metal transporter [Holophaga sp.]|nr:ZIP family metal transporter [Holophaga sp.]